MAVVVYENVGLWVAEYDVATDTNKATVGSEAKVLPATCHGDGKWEQNKLGVLAGTMNYEGLLDHSAADIEGDAFNNGATLAPVSMLPNQSDPPAVGDIAYVFRPLRMGREAAFNFGELAAGSVQGRVSGPMARGRLMSPKAVTTASTTRASHELGAVSADQKVYAALHVFAASGTSPTLDVTVRSDDNSGMSSPTTRLTFAQATAETSGWQQLAGPITDTHWDVDVVIGGTSPSFTFAVCVAIG